MADLYKLPDGRLIRRGNAFSIALPRTVVVPAVVGTDEDGNQYIAEPAKLMDTEVAQSVPANWLQIASAKQLEAFGIEPIEEEPDADQRFFSSAPLDVRDGVLRKNHVERPIEQLRRWLSDETKRQAADLIQQHYPLADQVNDQSLQIELANVAVPDTADDRELRRIRKRQGWVKEVRAYMRSLIDDIEALTNASEAKAWLETPAEWPEWPEKKAEAGTVKPTVEAVR